MKFATLMIKKDFISKFEDYFINHPEDNGEYILSLATKEYSKCGDKVYIWTTEDKDNDIYWPLEYLINFKEFPINKEDFLLIILEENNYGICLYEKEIKNIGEWIDNPFSIIIKNIDQCEIRKGTYSNDKINMYNNFKIRNYYEVEIIS